MSITASLILQKSLYKIKNVKYRNFVKFGVISFVFLTGLSVYGNSINRARNSALLGKSNDEFQLLPCDKAVDKNNYNLIFQYIPPTGATDYYPKCSFNNNINSNEKSRSILSQKVYLNGKNSIVRCNGRLKSYNISNRGTVSVSLDKRENMISIKYKMNPSYFVFLLVAGISLVFCVIKLILLRNKKDEIN